MTPCKEIIGNMIKKGQALYMKKHKTILLPLGRQFSIILGLFIVCTAGITLYNTRITFGYRLTFLAAVWTLTPRSLPKIPRKPTIATKIYAIARHTAL